MVYTNIHWTEAKGGVADTKEKVIEDRDVQVVAQLVERLLFMMLAAVAAGPRQFVCYGCLLTDALPQLTRSE